MDPDGDPRLYNIIGVDILLGYDEEIARLRKGIRTGVIKSQGDDPRIAKRTVSVPLAKAGCAESISHNCLLIVSIPGASTPAHFKRAAGCLAAIRRACDWNAGEAWVDREVFGSRIFRSDWKDHWFQALSQARRGLLFMSSEAHSPHLEWEFDRMNETFRSEDIVYVLLDADSDDPVFHYTRAFAQAQGSAVFSLSTSTPAEIGAYFASLDWTARVSSSASVRFASRAMTPHTNPEVQDISCIGPRTPLVFTVDGLIDSALCSCQVPAGQHKIDTTIYRESALGRIHDISCTSGFVWGVIAREANRTDAELETLAVQSSDAKYAPISAGVEVDRLNTAEPCA